MKYIFFSVFIAFGLVGCASTMKSVTMKRAAFDLNCPQEKLIIQELASRTWGVRGCGKRATYLTEGECTTEGSCHVILNLGEPQKD